MMAVVPVMSVMAMVSKAMVMMVAVNKRRVLRHNECRRGDKTRSDLIQSWLLHNN